MDIRLVAFDLDGTLLDDDKKISGRTMRALEKAAEKGIVLVPSTGRIRSAFPKAVLELPFVHYIITMNGSVVWDLDRNEVVYHSAFTRQQALSLWSVMQTVDSMNDMYCEGAGYMEPQNLEMIDEYAIYPQMIRLIRQTRAVIPSLEDKIRSSSGVDKFNMYFRDMTLLAEVKAQMQQIPYVKATTSVGNNIELNYIDADKGKALLALCRYLGIGPEQTMAFGDGDNDAAMLEAAGIGVAMANAPESVKDAADMLTLSNMQDGVACVLEQLWEEEQ